VTPRKQWTHARHPYLSGDVSAIRIDAAVLGLVPLLLHRASDPSDEPKSGGGGSVGQLSQYRLEQVASVASALLEAQDCIEAREYAQADELLAKALALDLRALEAHAMLGARALLHWPSLALRHFELGVAIGSLTVTEDFDGVLPWGFVDNRPFLRCLHGMARALVRLGRRDAAAGALRRLLRLDPVDALCARANLDALEAGRTWQEMEDER